MSWRGSIDVKDRVFSVCVYTFPLFYLILFFGRSSAYQMFPGIIKELIDLLTDPMDLINSVAGGFGGTIVFFALYFAVIRNESISRFIRFNAMQAILIDILLILCNIVVSIFGGGFSGSLIVESLTNIVFLSTLAVCLYSMIQSALGKYAEIPTISEAAASQVR